MDNTLNKDKGVKQSLDDISSDLFFLADETLRERMGSSEAEFILCTAESLGNVYEKLGLKKSPKLKKAVKVTEELDEDNY